MKKEKVKTKRDKWSQGEGCKQLEPHNDDRTNDQSDVESSASNATAADELQGDGHVALAVPVCGKNRGVDPAQRNLRLEVLLNRIVRSSKNSTKGID